MDCKFTFGGDKGKHNFEVDIIEKVSHTSEQPRHVVKFTSEVLIESKDDGNKENEPVNTFETQIEVFFANEID